MSELHSQLKDLTNPSSNNRRSTTPTSTTPTRHTPQGKATTTRSKSQSFLPITPREEATNDDTLKRTSQYKPRRAAPSKPAPSRPAPGRPNNYTSTFPRSIKGRSGDSQEEPLVISNTASLDDDEQPKVSTSVSGGRKLAKKDPTYKKKTESTEALLTESLSPNDRGTTKTTHSTAAKSKSISRYDPLAAKKKTPAKTSGTAEKRVNKSTHSMEPDRNRRELPHLKEMNQALQDNQAMADGEDDFILDPPQKFSQEDLEIEEPQNATGGALHFQDISEDNEPLRGAPPSNERRRWSNMERKIQGKKLGGKILSRQKTPANLGPDDDNDYDDVILPQLDDNVYDDIIPPNPPADNDYVDMDDYPFDESEDGFNDYDMPEAMEEDKLPNTVYDEEVAALIWWTM